MHRRFLLGVLLCALAACSRRTDPSPEQASVSAPAAVHAPAPAPLAIPPTPVATAAAPATVVDGAVAATGSGSTPGPRDDREQAEPVEGFQDMGHVVVDQRIAQEVLGWDGPLFMMVDPSTVMLQTECLEVDSSREAQPTVPADWDRHQSALGVSADVSLTILSAQGARPASVRALSCTRRGECNDGPRVLVSLGYPYPPGPPPSAVSAAREGVVPLQAKVVAVPADDKGCESRSIGKSAIERSPCRTVRRTLRSSSPPEGEIEILAARLQDPTECEQWRTLARVRSGDGPFSRWRTVLHSNRAPKVWAIFAPGAPDRFLIAAEYGCSGGGQTLRMIGLDGRVGFTVGREYVTGGANCD